MRLLSVMVFMIAFLLFSPLVQADMNPLLKTSEESRTTTVERVLTADKIEISGGEQVVLLGISGPNPPSRKDVQRDEHGFIIKDEDPTTSLEEEAFRYAVRLLEGKKVRLEFDVEHRNDDRHLQAYVFLPDGKMANVEMLRQGYADLKVRSPNTKYIDQFRAAYQEARKEMRGLQGQW